MAGIPCLRRSAAHDFFARVSVALMLGTALGCSQPKQQTAAQPGKGALASPARNQPSASTDSVPRAQQPAVQQPMRPEETSDTSATESQAGQSEHYYHPFALGPSGSGDSLPGRLSLAQYDRTNRVIHWPPLLREKQFSEVRYQLDQLFHQRKPHDSGLNSENYDQIKRQCEALQAILAPMIHQVDPQEFTGASRFVKGLEFEARFAAE